MTDQLPRRLAATVHLTDPGTGLPVTVDAGTVPEPRLADLITNPDAWATLGPEVATTADTALPGSPGGAVGKARRARAVQKP